MIAQTHYRLDLSRQSCKSSSRSILSVDLFTLCSPKKWNSSSGSVNEAPSGTAEMLLSEIAVLKNRTTEMEKECKYRVTHYQHVDSLIYPSSPVKDAAMQQVQERTDSIP